MSKTKIIENAPPEFQLNVVYFKIDMGETFWVFFVKMHEMCRFRCKLNNLIRKIFFRKP